MSYGISVSRPGFDVTDKNLSDKDLVFSSTFSTLKIYSIIYFSAAGIVAHGLDYAPVFFVIRYIEEDDDEYTFNVPLGYNVGNDPQLTGGTWISSVSTASWDDITGSGQDVVVDNVNVTSSVVGAVILCTDSLNE
jgi:hypothetical protein